MRELYQRGKMSRETHFAAPGNEVFFRNGKIRVKFEYSAVLVEIMREVKDDYGLAGNFDRDKKEWNFPIEATVDLAEKLRSKGFEWSGEALEKLKIAAAERLRDKGLDEKIEGFLPRLEEVQANGFRLYAHQKEGIAWMLRNRRSILADDMGLGKTVQALIATAALNEIAGHKTIVVCPANLIETWERAAREIDHPHYAVVSWNRLGKHMEETKALNRRKIVLVADEAHYAQNTKSQRTKAFLSAAAEADAVYMLTGTPMKNGKPANLFPLLKAARATIARVKADYEKRYCAARLTSIAGRRIWDASGASNMRELSEAIRPYLLRRTKKQCLDLPEKTRQIVPVEISKEERKNFSNQIALERTRYTERVRSGEVSEQGAALAAMTALRKIASEFKIASTVERAEEIIEGGGKVLIFGEYKAPLKAIAEKLGVTPYAGDTDSGTRQKIVDRFMRGEDPAFVASIAAGSTGLTLTEASYVILHDRALTPGDNDQAEDRAHRIGQSNPVTVYWPQAFTIDETIDEIVNSKREIISSTIDGAKGQKGASAKDVIRKVFSNENR